MVFTSFHESKDFRLNLGSSKVMFKKISQNFVKSPLKFCLISQILVCSLWHVFCTHVFFFSEEIRKYFRLTLCISHASFELKLISSLISHCINSDPQTTDGVNKSPNMCINNHLRDCTCPPQLPSHCSFYYSKYPKILNTKVYD